LLLFPIFALCGEKTDNGKELEQIFTLEREFYIEPFRNPVYNSTGKIEKAAAKFAKKKKDSDAKFRAKALLSAVYRSEEKIDKAVEIVADCADFDKISSNSKFPFKSSYLACFLELAHAKVGNCGAISSSPALALVASAGDRGGRAERENVSCRSAAATGGQVQAPAPSGNSASPNQNSGKLRSNFLDVQGLAPALKMPDYVGLINDNCIFEVQVI